MNEADTLSSIVGEWGRCWRISRMYVDKLNMGVLSNVVILELVNLLNVSLEQENASSDSFNAEWLCKVNEPIA